MTAPNPPTPTELLGCPFCGEKAMIDNEKGWSVGCFRDACGCEPFTGFHATREAAVERWNRRAPVDDNASQAAEIAGLREALNVIARASERSETMFGGKMSDVTRVFQNITRVARTATDTGSRAGG